MILATGVVPESWLIGQIKMIFLKKGRLDYPIICRGITLVNCLEKLLTCIINTQLRNIPDEIMF